MADGVNPNPNVTKPQHVEVSTKRTALDSCCKTPKGVKGNNCSSCGKPFEAGREAYEVELSLPNGKGLRDAEVKALIEDALPSEYVGAYEAKLEKSSRNTDDDPNSYFFIVTRRERDPMPEKEVSLPETKRLPLNEIEKQLAAKNILENLIKVADYLEEVKELDKVDVIDSIIDDVTKVAAAEKVTCPSPDCGHQDLGWSGDVSMNREIIKNHMLRAHGGMSEKDINKYLDSQGFRSASFNNKIVDNERPICDCGQDAKNPNGDHSGSCPVEDKLRRERSQKGVPYSWNKDDPRNDKYIDPSTGGFWPSINQTRHRPVNR